MKHFMIIAMALILASFALGFHSIAKNAEETRDSMAEMKGEDVGRRETRVRRTLCAQPTWCLCAEHTLSKVKAIMGADVTMLPILVTRKQAAALLGMSERSFNRHKKEIGPRPVKLGGTWYWRYGELCEWADAAVNGDLPDSMQWRARRKALQTP